MHRCDQLLLLQGIICLFYGESAHLKILCKHSHTVKWRSLPQGSLQDLFFYLLYDLLIDRLHRCVIHNYLHFFVFSSTSAQYVGFPPTNSI